MHLRAHKSGMELIPPLTQASGMLSILIPVFTNQFMPTFLKQTISSFPSRQKRERNTDS